MINKTFVRNIWKNINYVILIIFFPVAAISETFPTDSYSTSVALSEPWAYAGDGASGIKIINLTLGTAITYDDVDFGWVYDVTISGDYLFTAGANGLFILDISDRDNPSCVGEYATQGVAKSVCVAGDYAYISDYAYGFQVVYIGVPSTPSQMWADWQSAGLGDIWNVAVGDDGYLYAADVGNGFSVWDVSTPSAPVEVGSGFDTDGYALDIAVKSGSAYVADAWNGILTFDAGTPSSLSLDHELTTAGYGFGAVVSGNYLCLSEGDAGIRIYDISSQTYPDSGNEAFGYITGSETVDVVAYDSGNRAIMANGVGGILTLDLVAIPPEIITHPSNATRIEGESVTFSIVATGTSLNYQWQRNSSNISGAVSSSYRITSVAYSDNGSVFRCIVSNIEGSLTSNSAVLTVNLALPEIIRNPVDQIVPEGGSATFSVKALGTGLSYQWQRDGVTIPGATSASYTISSVSENDDHSVFRCIVSNLAGTATSGSASLRLSPFKEESAEARCFIGTLTN